MTIRKISRDLFVQKPYEAWNAFIDILAMERYDDLSAVQRIAQLCFWYDSEVQNGGHLQYFENRGIKQLDDTLVALGVIEANCQKDLLNAASRLFCRHPRTKIRTVDEYVAEARRGEFDALDSAFYACAPPIQELLATYFRQNESHFIEIINGRPSGGQ
jgi:hypothetical protein